MPSTLRDMKKPGFLPEIHALRGIGAFCIVLFHLAPLGGIQLPSGLGFIHDFFGSAVILFFVLSGFSLYLTTSWRVCNRHCVKEFYVKRFFRIAPMFYLALALNIAWIVYYWGAQVEMKTLLINVLFVFNFFPSLHDSYVMAGWIIGIEAIFYIVFPALLVAVKGRPGRIALMLVLLTTVSISANMLLARTTGLSPSYPYMNFLTHSIDFGAGIGAYYLFAKIGKERKQRLAYTALFVACILFFFLYRAGQWVRYISPQAAITPMFAYVFGVLVLAMLLGAVPFLTNMVTVGLGELSYSIYLLHPLVLVNMKPVYLRIGGSFSPLAAYIICACITFAIVVPLSYVTYRLVEEKGIRLGKRLIAAGQPV